MTHDDREFPTMQHIKNILVALDLGPDVEARVALAACLAQRFDATLTGVAGRWPAARSTVKDGRLLEARMSNPDARSESEELQDVWTIFHNAAGSSARVTACTDVADPARYLIARAAAGDLVVVGRQARDDHSDWRFAVDPGDIVLQVGQPVLVTPPGLSQWQAGQAVVAWKDTREARRAVRDALPLLGLAAGVSIVTIDENMHDTSARLVKDFLAGHGVAANLVVRWPAKDGIADDLLESARELGADLIVSGAYGHSRTREWIFGGVTRALLARSAVCCLFSN